MARIRLTRAFAVLVLIMAQAAFGLPHRMMGESAVAHGQAAGGGTVPGDCHHDGTSHPDAPVPPCGSCPASMPGPLGGCVDMPGCGPVSAMLGAAPMALLSTVRVTDLPPAISAPAAHDFIPDPPPPRA